MAHKSFASWPVLGFVLLANVQAGGGGVLSVFVLKHPHQTSTTSFHLGKGDVKAVSDRMLFWRQRKRRELSLSFFHSSCMSNVTLLSGILSNFRLVKHFGVCALCVSLISGTPTLSIAGA